MVALAIMSCTTTAVQENKPPPPTVVKEPLASRDEIIPVAPPLPTIKGKVLFATILHARDQSLMVLINPETTDRTNKSGEKSVSRLKTIQPFYIDLYEITVKRFTAFDLKYDEKPYTGNQPCPNCPAMAIDWFSANKYCRWAGKRLPTEEEWEMAAHGNTSTPWPWGNQFSPKYANLEGNEDGYLFAAPVGSFPQGASPYGVQDMIGNVWEWVSHARGAETIDPKKNPYVAKGGGWTSSPVTARISYRNIADPALKNPTFGFRCSKSLN